MLHFLRGQNEVPSKGVHIQKLIIHSYLENSSFAK